MTSLGDRLKFARKEAKLSQEKLARLVGVKQQAIGALENGDARSTTHLLRLAAALNVRPEWLERGAEPMRPAGEPRANGAQHVDLEARAQQLTNDLLKGRKVTSEEALACYREMLSLVRRWAGEDDSSGS